MQQWQKAVLVWNIDKSIDHLPTLTSAGEFLSAVSFLLIITSHSSGPSPSISFSSLVLFVFFPVGHILWDWLHATHPCPPGLRWTLPAYGRPHISSPNLFFFFFLVTPLSLSLVSFFIELSRFFPSEQNPFLLYLQAPAFSEYLVFAHSFSCSLSPIITFLLPTPLRLGSFFQSLLLSPVSSC